MKWSAMLLIMRPANIITAIADVIAGVAIVGYLTSDVMDQELVLQIVLLSIATAGLYGGGIVFNDIFDIEQDKINRPERIIPSGKLSLKQARFLGKTLFIIAIVSAFCVSAFSGYIAIAIMISALVYDKYGKHQAFLGPINMGLCRGLNLILGMSIASGLDPKYYAIGILPIIFISAITLTAQKETKGKNKLAIGFAMLLDASIVLGFWIISQHFDFSMRQALIFLILWYGVNLTAKANAIIKNTPKHIMKAVKIGVLSLIPLNASYVAGFSSPFIAVLVLCLLPISLFLAKKFPVT